MSRHAPLMAQPYWREPWEATALRDWLEHERADGMEAVELALRNGVAGHAHSDRLLTGEVAMLELEADKHRLHCDNRAEVVRFRAAGGELVWRIPDDAPAAKPRPPKPPRPATRPLPPEPETFADYPIPAPILSMPEGSYGVDKDYPDLWQATMLAPYSQAAADARAIWLARREALLFPRPSRATRRQVLPGRNG